MPREVCNWQVLCALGDGANQGMKVDSSSSQFKNKSTEEMSMWTLGISLEDEL